MGVADIFCLPGLPAMSLYESLVGIRVLDRCRGLLALYGLPVGRDRYDVIVERVYFVGMALIPVHTFIELRFRDFVMGEDRFIVS